MRLFEAVVLGTIFTVFGSACSVSAQTFSEDQASSPPTIYLTIPTEHGTYILPFVIVRTLHKHRKLRHPVALRPAAKAQKRYPLASSKPTATARRVRQLATSRTIPKTRKAPRLATAAVTHKEMPPRSQTVRQLASSKAAPQKPVTKERQTHHRAIAKAAPNSRSLSYLITSKALPKNQQAASKKTFSKHQRPTSKQAALKAHGTPLSPTTASREEAVSKKAAPEKQHSHRVAIQVDQNDPAMMNRVLDYAENVIKRYKGRDESAQVQIVAFGLGLHMLRNDTSPVRNRIEQLTNPNLQGVTFVACGSTQAWMEKREGKPITILPQATIAPSGVVRLMELQEQGWSYVRP